MLTLEQAKTFYEGDVCAAFKEDINERLEKCLGMLVEEEDMNKLMVLKGEIASLRWALKWPELLMEDLSMDKERQEAQERDESHDD